MKRGRVAFSTPAGPLVVSVEVPAALDVVAALFPDDRTDAPASAPWMTLRAEPGGFALDADSGAWRAPDLPSLLVRLELSLAEEMVRRSGLVGVHAGGVVVGGGTLLLPGEGGSGKSSLVAALARLGCAVLADDVVLLDRAGRAHPFRRLLKVEEPARTLLGLPEGAGALRKAWPEAWFYRPRDLGTTWAEAAPVRWAVLPRRADGETTALVPTRAAQLVPTMVAGLVLRERVDPGAFETVVTALDGAACFELRYDATSEGAAVLLDALA